LNGECLNLDGSNSALTRRVHLKGVEIRGRMTKPIRLTNNPRQSSTAGGRRRNFVFKFRADRIDFLVIF
jgi:hypothetical protein